jgi:hypothetical protein
MVAPTHPAATKGPYGLRSAYLDYARTGLKSKDAQEFGFRNSEFPTTLPPQKRRKGEEEKRRGVWVGRSPLPSAPFPLCTPRWEAAFLIQNSEFTRSET